MNKIIFLGNSLAAVKVIEEIRRVNSEVEITLISTDGMYPYDRDKIFPYLSREIKEKQALCHPESFYKTNNVRVITDQTVARLNFKRNQVFFENKEHLNYDTLALADLAAPRLPAIKGSHKEGVYSCARLKDAKLIAEQMPFVEMIVVQLSSMLGFKTLCALSSLGKEVVVSASEGVLLPGILDAESASILKQLLEQSGIRLMLDNPIEEILGDLEAKAVRLKSGKVLAAQMVILDDLRLDTRIIKESGLAAEAGSSSGGTVDVNFKNVYFLDAFFNSFQNVQTNDYGSAGVQLQRQGILVAQQILGQNLDVSLQSGYTRFKVKGLTGFWFGDTRAENGASEHFKFDNQKNIYRKIFVKDNRLAGAVYLNADEQFSRVFDVFEKQMEIQGLEEKLLEDGVNAVETVNLQS